MKPIPKRPFIPILTDLFEYREVAKHTISYTKKKIEKYGDVFECSFTGIKNYFIHDPEIIKEILTTLGPKMKRTYFFQAFRKYLGNGLFTSDGDFHKQQRKLIKPAFYPQRIDSYANIMVECANNEIKNWKEGDEININKAITRITLQIITRAMFGSGIDNKTIEEVEKNLQSSFELMNKILSNPFYTHCLIKEIKIPIVITFFKLKTEADRVINSIIASYHKDGNTTRLDLLSMLMEAKDEDTGIKMTDEQIRDEVMTFFLAGHETTTLALTWTLYLLGMNPEINTHFLKEVKEQIGSRLPHANDYQTLHLTKNIFKESLRLYPPAWTFARAPIEDVVIKDYHFPKDCVLWTITYLMHHDEKYFHHPEKFIPSRWDEEKIRELPKYVYFPFGGGNRMCIGEGFAWMEGVLVLATIAQKFKLELKENFTTTVNPLFTLKPKDNIIMTCKSNN